MRSPKRFVRRPKRFELLVLSVILVALSLAVFGDFFEDALLEGTIDLASVQRIVSIYETLGVAIGVSMGFDAVADSYDEVRAVPSWALEKFFDKILEKKGKVGHDLVILDAGIGSGRTVGPLLSRGVHVVGVDISSRMLAKALKKIKEKPNARADLIRADIAHLPLRPQSFDIVISIHVLWLLKKWRDALLDIRRVMKQDGFFVSAEHSSPEFTIKGIGMKCWELEEQAFGHRGFISRFSSTIRPVTRFLPRSPQTKRFQHTVRELIRSNGWETHVAKISRSMETFVISWNNEFKASTIVGLLEKRTSSLELKLAASTMEKFRQDLAKWENRELRSKPSLELKECFTFTIVWF